MKKAKIPQDEASRISELQGLGILDTSTEERFDRYTRLAARLFDVPIALVSLVDSDRQWFKSRVGLEVRETSRDISLCGHAILEDEPFVVPDTKEDDRFRDNPLVQADPRIRFYAGAPLRGPAGAKLGTLCLIDDKPRTFDARDIEVLKDLAGLVEGELGDFQAVSTDPLTGLTNRAGFEALAPRALIGARRREVPMALLYGELDGFKRIHDTFGHVEGEAALMEFASLLLRAFRDTDIIARFGGEGFCVLAALSNPGDARYLMARIRRLVAERNAVSMKPYPIATSLGAVLYDEQRHQDVGAMVAEAHTLMHQDKRAASAGYGIGPTL